MQPGERGVSPIVGIILLFGLVALGSLSIFIVGTELISDTEQQLEQERIEQSFIEMSQAIATEAQQGGMGSQLELEAGEQGAITRENTGTMEVHADNLDEPIGFDIGTVEWEGDDGTTVAYQGGGVFRDTGEETQLLSLPSIHYDLETETLTMPVYNVTGDGSLQSGTVNINQDSIAAEHEVSHMQEDNVTIRVESEYYLGWKQYFEREAGDTIVTDYGSLDGDFGYVVVELGFIQFEDTFENGVTHSGECNGQGGGCDQHGWNITEGDPSQPMDPVVEQMINNPEAAMDQPFDDVYEEDDLITDEFENEYVLIDRDLDGESIEVDLTDGNTTLAVDGDIRNTDIRVTENHPDHTLQMYANGSYLSDDADVCVDDCNELNDGSTIQIFGTSEMGIQFGTGGEPHFEGLIYAASDEDEWDHVDPDPDGQCTKYDQLCVQATPQIYGGIVVNTADIQGGDSLSIEMDPDLDESEIDFKEDLLPPQITYMSVVEHRMTVKNP